MKRRLRAGWDLLRPWLAGVALALAARWAAALAFHGRTVIATDLAAYLLFLAGWVGYRLGREHTDVDARTAAFLAGWRGRGEFEDNLRRPEREAFLAARDAERARAEEKSELDRHRIETTPKPPGGAS